MAAADGDGDGGGVSGSAAAGVTDVGREALGSEGGRRDLGENADDAAMVRRVVGFLRIDDGRLLHQPTSRRRRRRRRGTSRIVMWQMGTSWCRIWPYSALAVTTNARRTSSDCWCDEGGGHRAALH